MIIDNVMGLTTENNDAGFTDILEHPMIFVRGYPTKQNVGKSILLKYYVTDYNNKDFLDNDYSETFTTVVEINGKVYKKTTYAGNSSIIIDGISEEGDYIFSIKTVDSNGISSPMQYFKVWVTDELISSSNIYNMKEADLTTYNITVGEISDVGVAKNNKEGLTKLFSAIKNLGYKQIKMLQRIYMLDYHGDDVVFPSDFTVDLNQSTIKVLPCTDLKGGTVFCIRKCKNTHIINGNIYGNADVFDADATKTETSYNIPGEWLSVIDILSGEYCSFENINVKYPVGYNLDIGMSSDTGVSGGYVTFADHKYIDSNGNEQTTTKNICTSDFKDLSKFGDCEFFKVARYLGYSGYSGDNPTIYVHLYDGDKGYLRTVKSRQYLDIPNETNTKYIRVTAFGTADSLKDLVLHSLGSSRNCYIRNCSFSNSRTCLFHPTICQNITIDNCTFENVCTEILKYPVTSMIADFEDGWLNCRDIFIKNCSVKKDDNSIIMAITGFNYNFLNNNGFSYTIRDGCYGVNICGNIINTIDFTASDVKYKQNFTSIRNSSILKDCTFRYSGSQKLSFKLRNVAYKNCNATSQNVTVIKNKCVQING